MFRLFVVVAAFVCATQCTNANAQGRSGKTFRGGNKYGHSHAHKSYRSRPSSSFGFSIQIGGSPGFGYGYPGSLYLDPYRDPYRTGRFQVPDLLDDPWFTEQHRYDSQFPGRRRRAPLVVQPLVPSYPSFGHVPDRGSPPIASVDPSDLARQLQAASQQLSHSLAARHDGNAWMEYLAPNQIGQLVDSGDVAELRELLSHFDGVVGNTQLRYIAALHGFGTTRHLLRQYVDQRSEATGPREVRPKAESLPIPPPENESLPIPQQEKA